MWNPLKKTKIYNLYVICATASIGGLLYGIDVASMSAVIGTAAYKSAFGHPVSHRQGSIVAAMPGGSFFGAVVSSHIADRFGRRIAIQAACTIWIFGTIVSCFAGTAESLIVGRAISGFAVGISSSVVPIYQAEMATKANRGRVISFHQWAVTWGVLIQFLIQYGFSQMDGGPLNPHQSSMTFRLPWALQTIPAVVLFIMMYFLPESPRWFAVKDNWTESINVLTKVHGGGNVNHTSVLAEFRQIERSLEDDEGSSYAALIDSRMISRVILGVSIQSWAQLSGIVILMSYIVLIMETTGVRDPLLAASAQFLISVVLTIPAFMMLDKYGRRPALLVGSAFMMVWLIATGCLQGIFGKKNPHTNPEYDDITWVMDNKHAGRAVMACLYLFIATYAMTWGPVSWVYPSEIFPSRLRAKAVSVATAFAWVFNFLFAYAVPTLLWYINYKTYFIFAGFNLVAFIHMFMTAPETKGMSLEDMDAVFASGRRPWSHYRAGSHLDDIVGSVEGEDQDRQQAGAQASGETR
ncbi:uncharacterized protein K452DRAFT_303574 [Aplosporella prunicola CBS 121167]|uniref:Major facilitator superfamily (MFS) profile domain-containing protein n=1 Tax=Aplosporella prunicola CBS 121167 TaxID=1176127 RepID=A0A6A6AUW1_9PEZI|nr:uncharacterized protein K452DRAFT_303574 [Aplosporella prunicola CBS 121167]KAF2135386.1 hypothetical protein K452DRAFT_303574 [Aplosporella prunicola CBS 121167]